MNGFDKELHIATVATATIIIIIIIIIMTLI